MSESGIFDVFVLLGPSPRDVFRQYAQVTGTQALPPYWAIAYHQCRWNYFSEQEVAEVDKNFDTYNIPYDVLWLDIEHTDGKKYFTWNREKFPHPEDMLRNMSARGKRVLFFFSLLFHSLILYRFTSLSLFFPHYSSFFLF
jgi:alpha 1,3-glucosidase